MNRSRGAALRTLAGLLGWVVVIVPLLAENPTRAVLVKAAKPYDALTSAIEGAGGRITHRFAFVDGLAAEIPEDALSVIGQLAGPGNIGRDELLPLPATYDPRSGEAVVAEAEGEDVVPLEGADTFEPQTYTYSASLNGLTPLHAAGNTGKDVVIAVIDSGYRPLFPLSPLPQPSRIISPGFNFVPDIGEPPAVSDANNPHGTQVASIAAANRALCFPATSRLVVVAEAYGVAVRGGCPTTSRLIQMVGSAPGARILPMKVFPAAGGTAPASRLIQAIEKAIQLRRDFNANPENSDEKPKGINIGVVNISVGGPTNAAARTLVDLAIDELLRNDIVPVIAAGNDGFSSVTVSSPATSLSALTVGAASTAVHERIFHAQFTAPCSSAPLSAVLNCTRAFRPDDNIQIAEFSSRGPTHDGRIDPDVVVNGAFAFTQGAGLTSTTTSWVSGTSFAGPWVAGIAAVLRQAFPDATARQIRNAIVMSADPAKIETATPNDQGAGFVNADAASATLAAQTVPDTVSTAFFTRSVPGNMARAGRPVYQTVASVAFTNIRPAEIAEVPFLVSPNTRTLHVRIHSIVALLPRTEQNQFFGDNVLLRVQSAAVHRPDRRVDTTLAPGSDTTFAFDRPESGVWRITLSGKGTNAGLLSFNVEVWTSAESSSQHTVKADIAPAGAPHVYTVAVPPATSALGVRLEWGNMEARYPVSDLDVILTPPVGPAVSSCTTVRAPEACTIANPAAGLWTVKVIGVTVPSFGLPGDAETYTLRLSADGVVLKLAR